MASYLRNSLSTTRALPFHVRNCPSLPRITATRPGVPSHSNDNKNNNNNNNIVRSSPLTQRKTMATSSSEATGAAAAPKKFEWLVVVPDFPGVHQKRLEVRPQHFANLGPAKESGLFQMGGAVLNEVPTSDDPSTFSFAGSTVVMLASSREEIKEMLRKDVYATSGVWDVENAQMWPLLCAFRNQK